MPRCRTRAARSRSRRQAGSLRVMYPHPDFAPQTRIKGRPTRNYAAANAEPPRWDARVIGPGQPAPMRIRSPPIKPRSPAPIFGRAELRARRALSLYPRPSAEGPKHSLAGCTIAGCRRSSAGQSAALVKQRSRVRLPASALDFRAAVVPDRRCILCPPLSAAVIHRKGQHIELASQKWL